MWCLLLISVLLTDLWAVNVENHIRLCSDKLSYVFSKHLRVLSSPDVLIQSEGFIARNFFCLQTDKIGSRPKVKRLDDPSGTEIVVIWKHSVPIHKSRKTKERMFLRQDLKNQKKTLLWVFWSVKVFCLFRFILGIFLGDSAICGRTVLLWENKSFQ